MACMWIYGIGAVLLVAFEGAVSTSLEAERVSEAVTIKLYRLDADGWNSRAYDVKTDVKTQTNTYCYLTPSACGLTYWDPAATFNESSVGAVTVTSGSDLEVSLYILLPTGANVSSVSPTQFVVNGVAVKEMITNIRAQIEGTVDSYITYIGEDYYGIPPANRANQILIPIAFIVVFAIIITAVALHIWNKKKAHSKVRSARNNVMGKSNDSHNTLKGGHVNNSEMFQARHANTNSSPDISDAKRTQTSSLNEFVEVDETRRHNAPLPLQPVDDMDDSRRKEKKKKKKKKKRHHRDSEGPNHDQSELTVKGARDYDNPSYDQNDSDP